MGWSAAENASASIKLESTRAAGFSTQANRALAIVRNGKGGREEIAQLTGFLDLQTGELPPLDPMRFVIRATIESLARIAAETEARPES
jgi:hypothetical protein